MVHKKKVITDYDEVFVKTKRMTLPKLHQQKQFDKSQTIGLGLAADEPVKYLTIPPISKEMACRHPIP